MRFSHLLWLSMAVAAPMSGEAAIFGWGTEKKVEAESNEVPTPQSSRTIRRIIGEDRRFVLYNSRKLSGECLDTCVPIPDPPTPVPRTRPPAPEQGAETPPPTDAPTGSPTKKPTEDPTSSPTKKPTEDPTSSPTKSPTLSPKGLDCTTLKDLGYGFSGPTGNRHYRGCYPGVKSISDSFEGYDDSLGVFVGGNYIGRNGAEIEGNMVVLGDLKLTRNGPTNFGSVGVGSQVVPSNNGDCILVGGDLIADKQTQVYNKRTSMKCDVVYGGSGRNVNNFRTNGEVRRDADMDLTFYENMTKVWERKSKYWATLPPTGDVLMAGSTTEFECKSNTGIEVFNVYAEDASDWRKLRNPTSMKFRRSCEGKSILINAIGSGKLIVRAAAMYDYAGRKGYRQGGFSPCFTQNILWNFPYAEEVVVGGGGSSEFHGAILVTGDFFFKTSGHSGRAIVLGDIIHDRGGSEFHNYPYNPSTSLPDPENICDLDGAVGNYPTLPPTAAPVPTECTAAHNNQGVTDEMCKQCNIGSKKPWWPCRQNPPLCVGRCI